jgi:hypothetical protein
MTLRPGRQTGLAISSSGWLQDHPWCALHTYKLRCTNFEQQLDCVLVVMRESYFLSTQPTSMVVLSFSSQTVIFARCPGPLGANNASNMMESQCKRQTFSIQRPEVLYEVL